MTRRILFSALAALSFPLALATAPASRAEEAKTGILYKNPQCDCCEEYAKYLERSGYTITIEATHDLSAMKRFAGVPEALDGCHTSVIGGYVFEGHVPVEHVDRVLSEKPDIRGISLPGMLPGTPGMTGRKSGPYTIYEIGKDRAQNTNKVYVVY
jgi:hypothetical protein